MTKRRFRRVRAYTLFDGDIFWSNKTGQEFRRIKSCDDFIYVWTKECGKISISRDDWRRLLVWVEVT